MDSKTQIYLQILAEDNDSTYISRSRLNHRKRKLIPPIPPDLGWIRMCFHHQTKKHIHYSFKTIKNLPSPDHGYFTPDHGFFTPDHGWIFECFWKKTKKKNQWILCFLSIFNSRKDNRSSGEKYCRDLPAQPPDPSIHIPSWGWEGAYHSFWSEFAGQTCRGRGIWWIYIYMILEYWYVLVISSRWKELHMEA